MINTDVLYNTFIYFFTGYGVMACTINLFNLLNKINKVNKVDKINEDGKIDEVGEINEVGEDTVVENFEYIKLGKRKKII
jgi:hypothetical protein